MQKIIIWNPNGIKAPGFSHETMEGALKEADRLAKTNPGQKFFVMVQAGPVVEYELNKVKPDIPF